ncbi:MAG: ATP-binding protein [Deltaproteobacteria bacterium]|nr:ATP-binding protein [Deltaproteobacteria bacterium]
MKRAFAGRVFWVSLVTTVLPAIGLASLPSARWPSLVLAACSLVACGSLTLLAHHASARALLLTRALERVGQGDTSVRVRPRGNDELDDALNAFNQAMTRMDLMQARTEELERISAWQEFARRLAHEIKNPLTPILLAVQEVARKCPSTDPVFARTVASAHEIVTEEIATLQRLVSAFSEFARLPEVKRVRGDLQEFLRDAAQSWELLDREDPTQTGEVRVVSGTDPQWVELDRIMLRRAMDNLVRNALQAGASVVTVRIETPETQPEAVWLVIEDDGPGISASLGERVFEPYYTTRTAGTGLGLAIVRKIALDHDGDAIFDSDFTKGARFVVALPRAITKREGVSFVTLRATQPTDPATSPG